MNSNSKRNYNNDDDVNGNRDKTDPEIPKTTTLCEISKARSGTTTTTATTTEAVNYID